MAKIKRDLFMSYYWFQRQQYITPDHAECELRTCSVCHAKHPFYYVQKDICIDCRDCKHPNVTNKMWSFYE